MASQLYLIILFAVTLLIFSQARGSDDNEKNRIDMGLSLVPAAPVVLVQQRMRTPVLLNCSLTVTNTSLLPLSYRWTKDGQDLELDHQRSRMQLLPNGSLVLQTRRSKGRNRTLDGVYDCRVTTATKDVVIARRVTVVVASITKNNSIEISPKDAYKGGFARIVCNIRAEPVASYIWHRNDTQLPQDDVRFVSLPSGVLQISDLELSDTGLYWCQATTYLFTSQEQMANFGWKKGRRVELRVKADSTARPPVILAAPQNTSVLIGHTAEFECFADGNPLPSVAWKKIGSDVAFGPQQISRHGNLQISPVAAEDAGVYECTVSGRRGRVLKFSATLSVLEPPKLEELPGSYYYAVASSLKTSCMATGSPPLKFSWYHNGVPVKEADDLHSEPKDRPEKNGQDLYLFTAQRKNSGFYQCVAENSVGRVMTVAFLRFVIAPDAPPTPSNVRCTAVNSTAFQVTWDHSAVGTVPYIVTHLAVGSMRPVQDFCHRNNIINETRQQCVIGSLQPYTNYSVRVQAYSSKGASDISDKIFVRTKEDVPKVVPLVTVTSPEFHTLLVSWTPLTPEQSRGRVTAYRIYYRSADKKDETSIDVEGDQTSYLIRGVEAEKTYEVLVIAATSEGFTKRDQWPWTSFSTPATNASSPPRLVFKLVNTTAVGLEWQAPLSQSTPAPDHQILSYSLQLQNLNKPAEPVRQITVPASVRSYLLTQLDNEQFYQLTLVAVMKHGNSSPTVSEFQLQELQNQLVPDKISADLVTADSVSLSWTGLPGVSVTYEICYGPELDTSEKQCRSSIEPRMTVSGLTSFTRYEFNVRTLVGSTRAANSKNIIIQTLEEKPSPPTNLTVKVQQNSVKLNWLPPIQPNGVITHYTIMYGKDQTASEDTTWKSITQKGTDTTAQLDDLEAGQYLFKLAAHNKAGPSQDTQVVTAVLICQGLVQASCSFVTGGSKDKVDVTASPSEGVVSSLSNTHMSVIIGCVVGLILLVVLILVLRHFCGSFRRFSREQDPNTSNTPIYRINGHVSPVPVHLTPGNGHIHLTGNTAGNGRPDTNETMPMLKQIAENDHLDTKGGPDYAPNGFLPNGAVKDLHKLMGHTHHKSTINSSNNSEELQGLMAALLNSTDPHQTINSNKWETLAMSSLEDIDRTEDLMADNTSQDSGMGGRLTAKYHHRTDGLSPASSLEEMNGQNPAWEMGRQLDEIGGVFICRSTGAIMSQLSHGAQSDQKTGELDEPAASEKVSEDNNDRDSGHGSEVKSQGGVWNIASQDVNTSMDMDIPLSASPPALQSEEMMVSVLPPPPPSPPLLTSSASSSLSTSSSSSSAAALSPVSFSQQLPGSRSRHQPGGTRAPSKQGRNLRQHTSHTDLPPPPPSPPLGSPLTLLPSPSSWAAEAIQLNSSNSEEGQQQLTNGSILSRQSSQGEAALTFWPSASTSSVHHLA